MSMLDYFKDMLEEGQVPVDPFEAAIKTADDNLTEAQKEAWRLAWNNRIAMHYGGEEAMRKRMLARRARRMIRRR